MLRRVSAAELTEWLAYYELRAAAAEADEAARAKQPGRPPHSPPAGLNRR